MLPSISPNTGYEENSQVMETYANMTSEGLNGTTPSPKGDPLSFDDFAPTLAQCFFIVLTSYFIGKIKLLSASDVRGVTAFAAYFAMPGIICVKMADADIENIEWQLLAGVVLGKAIIFGIVAGCTLLVIQPADLSTAAMLAMFCVQCNDLPVGNPLMSSLYGGKRPYMLKYLFLIPALTIVFFGPVTHIMMEEAKDKDKEKPLNKGIQRSSSKTSFRSKVSRTIRLIFHHRMTGEIILNLMKNPVIIATFFGIILNVSFKAHVPSVLHQPINVVATMIPGLALSVLGFSMIGKERHILSSGIILAIVLIAVKMVLTPLVLFFTVKSLVGDHNQKMLDFSLLYGIISPAAIIFQYGEKYRFPIAAMSAALILSSFTCFPLSYIIAKLSLDEGQDLSYYLSSLNFILFLVAILSVLCCIAVYVSLLWNKQWKKAPCWYIFYLCFTQVWMSLGVIFWHISDGTYPTMLKAQFIMACGGEIMICFWTATLFLLLILLQNNQSTGTKSTIIISTCTFGLSVIIIIVLCMHIFHFGLHRVFLFGQPKYGYEYFQLEIITAVLSAALMVGAISFVLYRKRRDSTKDFGDPVSVSLETQAEKGCAYAVNLKVPESEENEKRVSTVSTASTVAPFNDQDEKTMYYDEVIKMSQSEKILVFGAEWTSRLISLMTLLWITLAIKCVTNILKIIDYNVTAMMVPLEYLQAILFTGQGLWTFLTCGVDIRTAFISLKKRWRQMRYGQEKPQENVSLTENEELQRQCQQFRMFFYESCFKELAKERIWKKNHYQNSFWGHQMVNWLITAGVVKDELEAEEYGENLLLGGIISHVRNAHQFLDAPYLYYFVKH